MMIRLAWNSKPSHWFSFLCISHEGGGWRNSGHEGIPFYCAPGWVASPVDRGSGQGVTHTCVCVCTQWGQGTPRASDAGFHFSRGKSFASELDFQGSVRLKKKKSSRAGCERGWGPRRQKDLQTPPPTRRGTSRSTTFNEVDLYIQFLNGDMANFKLSVKHFHFVIKVPIFTRNGNTPPPQRQPHPRTL